MKPTRTSLLRASALALLPFALGAQTAFQPAPSVRFDPAPADFTAALPTDADLAPHDYLIPRRGKSIATLLTGVPYAAIAEYAYGFTDRLSAGVIAGVLENSLPGYGVRVRYVVAQPGEKFRVNLRVPIIFYPEAKSFGCPGCEAWFLAWPAVNAEWRLARGKRVWAGAGAVATACASTVFRTRNAAMARGEGVHEGTWNTFQLGFSQPLTRRVSFQLEAAAVMKGARLATHTWVGGPPVILTTGFSYSF